LAWAGSHAAIAAVAAAALKRKLIDETSIVRDMGRDARPIGREPGVAADTTTLAGDRPSFAWRFFSRPCAAAAAG
jgi:hypothetical protein